MTIKYLARINNQSSIETADLLSGVSRSLQGDQYFLIGKMGVEEFIQGIRFNVESAWGVCDFIKATRIDKIENTEMNYVTMNQVNAPDADSMEYITISLVRHEYKADKADKPKPRKVAEFDGTSDPVTLPKKKLNSPVQKPTTDEKHIAFLEKCLYLLQEGKFTSSHIGCIITQGNAYLKRTGEQARVHHEYTPEGMSQYATVKTSMARSLWKIPANGVIGFTTIIIKKVFIETNQVVIVADVPYEEDNQAKKLEVRLTTLKGVKWQ